MSKVARSQTSPACRRLGESSPFQKARSRFVIGSPIMHHSPSESPFFVRNSSVSSSTPKIKEEPEWSSPSPVVRWVHQKPQPWGHCSSDEELATSLQRDILQDDSSEESEKCYSLTYEEESAVTLELMDDDVDLEEELLVPKIEVVSELDSVAKGTFSVKQLRTEPSKKCRLMTWYDPTMVSMLKHLALALSDYESLLPPLIVHPLEMIQFKVHAPRYTDLTPVIGSNGSSPLLAEMVARVTRQPHSHVKLTLPNGEKLQIISQDAWPADIDEIKELNVEGSKRLSHLIKTPRVDKWTTTEQQICNQCHLLKAELEHQNKCFREQIKDMEQELDTIRERLTLDGKQMEVLELTLKEEREDYSKLQETFTSVKKSVVRLPLWSKERKRTGSNSQLMFDKNKVVKKSRTSLGSAAATNRLRAANLPDNFMQIKAMTTCRIPKHTSESMENHPDTNVRKLYQTMKLSDDEKVRLEENVKDLKRQLENAKDHHQRALENELIQLREQNQLLTESYQSEKIARKRFFSMLEDAKGKIRVYCRIRPLLPNESLSVLDCIDDYTVALNGVRGRQEFQFDHVFHSKHTQEDVFTIAKDMVNLAYDGYNVCIFGYGQTGSGKTYTLLGDPHGKDPGIASRAFLKLFELIDESESTQETIVHISAMELYNEKLLDLMHPQGAPEEKLEIRKEANGMVNVLGCKSKRVNKPSSLLAIFYEACARRHVASTKMNSRSSRSHLIITLLIESTSKISGAVARGKFSLVDLAGSERQAKSNTVSAQLKEANSINKSLSALGDVIAALASEQPHVPYRNNKLTQLMQDSLGGNAKTLMFVNVSPAEFNLEETTSSLHYAARVKQIKNDPSRMTESREIARLKAIISHLRKGDVNEA